MGNVGFRRLWEVIGFRACLGLVVFKMDELKATLLF